MPRVKIIDQGQPEDTEGNAIRGKGGVETGEPTGDTEGHAARGKALDDGSEDDTEGNVSRGRG